MSTDSRSGSISFEIRGVLDFASPIVVAGSRGNGAVGPRACDKRRKNGSEALEWRSGNQRLENARACAGAALSFRSTYAVTFSFPTVHMRVCVCVCVYFRENPTSTVESLSHRFVEFADAINGRDSLQSSDHLARRKAFRCFVPQPRCTRFSVIPRGSRRPQSSESSQNRVR